MTPSPPHSGHAPLELALNSDASALCALANALRMWSRIPVYVAVLDRRDPRGKLWSTTTVSGCCATRHPWMSELFPDPATPVTTVSTPSGTFTVTFFRLCSLAFFTVRESLLSRTPGFSDWRRCRN